MALEEKTFSSVPRFQVKCKSFHSSQSDSELNTYKLTKFVIYNIVYSRGGNLSINYDSTYSSNQLVMTLPLFWQATTNLTLIGNLSEIIYFFIIVLPTMRSIHPICSKFISSLHWYDVHEAFFLNCEIRCLRVRVLVPTAMPILPYSKNVKSG